MSNVLDFINVLPSYLLQQDATVTGHWTFDNQVDINGRLNLDAALRFTSNSPVQDGNANNVIEFDGAGNITFPGNVTINGDTTSTNTNNLLVDAPLALFADGNDTDSLDIGWVGQRFSQNIANIWDESNDWFAFIFTDEDGTTSGNVTINSLADIRMATTYADIVIAGSPSGTTQTGDINAERIFENGQRIATSDGSNTYTSIQTFEEGIVTVGPVGDEHWTAKITDTESEILSVVDSNNNQINSIAGINLDGAGAGDVEFRGKYLFAGNVVMNNDLILNNGIDILGSTVGQHIRSVIEGNGTVPFHEVEDDNGNVINEFIATSLDGTGAGYTEFTGEYEFSSLVTFSYTAGGQSVILDHHLKFSGIGSNVPVIKTPGAGNSAVRVYDDSSGQELIRFDEGGPVEIANVDLTLGQDLNMDNNTLNIAFGKIAAQTGTGISFTGGTEDIVITTDDSAANAVSRLAFTGGSDQTEIRITSADLVFTGTNSIEWPSLGRLLFDTGLSSNDFLVQRDNTSAETLLGFDGSSGAFHLGGFGTQFNPLTETIVQSNFRTNYAVQVGSPTDGYKTPGSVNAEKLFENGTRVTTSGSSPTFENIILQGGWLDFTGTTREIRSGGTALVTLDGNHFRFTGAGNVSFPVTGRTFIFDHNNDAGANRSVIQIEKDDVMSWRWMHDYDDQWLQLKDASQSVVVQYNQGGDVSVPNGTFNVGNGQTRVYSSGSRRVDFDGDDAMITVHDGHGNFNIKAGIDEGNVITGSDGGSHVRLDDSGNIELTTYTGTVGTTGTTNAYIRIVNTNLVNVADATLEIKEGAGGHSGNIVLHNQSAQVRFTDTNSFTDTNDEWIVNPASDLLRFMWHDSSAGATDHAFELRPDLSALFTSDLDVNGELNANSGINTNSSSGADHWLATIPDSATNVFTVQDSNGNQIFKLAGSGLDQAGAGFALAVGEWRFANKVVFNDGPYVEAVGNALVFETDNNPRSLFHVSENGTTKWTQQYTNENLSFFTEGKNQEVVRLQQTGVPFFPQGFTADGADGGSQFLVDTQKRRYFNVQRGGDLWGFGNDGASGDDYFIEDANQVTVLRLEQGGDVSIPNGTVTTSNNQYYQSTDASNNERRLLGISNNDHVYIGDIDGIGNETRVRSGGVDTLLLASDHGAYMVNSTGNSQGTGTFNAVQLYEQGVALADKYTQQSGGNTFSGQQNFEISGTDTNFTDGVTPANLVLANTNNTDGNFSVINFANAAGEVDSSIAAKHIDADGTLSNNTRESEIHFAVSEAGTGQFTPVGHFASDLGLVVGDATVSSNGAGTLTTAGTVYPGEGIETSGAGQDDHIIMRSTDANTRMIRFLDSSDNRVNTINVSGYDGTGAGFLEFHGDVDFENDVEVQGKTTLRDVVDISIVSSRVNYLSDNQSRGLWALQDSTVSGHRWFLNYRGDDAQQLEYLDASNNLTMELLQGGGAKFYGGLNIDVAGQNLQFDVDSSNRTIWEIVDNGTRRWDLRFRGNVADNFAFRNENSNDVLELFQDRTVRTHGNVQHTGLGKVEFDGNEAMITVHDGHGNFNIKAGVDEDNVITGQSGGSHIQMKDDGDVRLITYTGNVGDNASQAVNLSVDLSSVSIRGGGLVVGDSPSHQGEGTINAENIFKSGVVVLDEESLNQGTETSSGEKLSASDDLDADNPFVIGRLYGWERTSPPANAPSAEWSEYIRYAAHTNNYYEFVFDRTGSRRTWIRTWTGNTPDSWRYYYDTNNKPSAGDVDAVSQTNGGTFDGLVRFGHTSGNNSIEIDQHVKFTGAGTSNPVIRTPGGGADSVRIFDDANNNNIAQFHEGGNVDIPGDISTPLIDATVVAVSRLNFDNTENTSGNDGDVAFDASEGLLIHRTSAPSGEISTTGQDFVVLDRSNIQGGNGINISGGEGSGSAPVTFAVDSSVAQSGDNVSQFNNDANYVDASGARNAVEAGNLTQIDGVNNFRIRFNSSTSWIEFTDQSNNREEIVTKDTYINDLNGGTWLGDLAPSDIGAAPSGHTHTLSDITDSGTAAAADTANSVTISGGNLQLVGDESSPGADQVYGTDGSGNKGWINKPSGGLEWSSIQSANFTATAGEAYPIDSSGGNVTVTLPASPSHGDTVTVMVASDTADITIDRNGNTIEGQSQNLNITDTYPRMARLVWMGGTITDWRVVAT